MCVMAVPLLLMACGIMPVEEELPAAPVIRSYEATEYQQATVMRGDMELTQTVKCSYASARQEKYSFSLGGMYIDKVYVTEGQQVRKGALLAELEQGDLARQISEGEYALQVLQIRQAHLPAGQALELSRRDAIIAGMEEKIKHFMAMSRNDQEDEERQAWIDRANEILLQKIEQEKQKEELEELYANQLQDAEDAVYIAQLQLKELKQNLQDRQIRAGISGTVTYLQKIKEGDRSVKGKVFVTVADLGTVVFTVKGENAQYFPVGTQVTVLCEKKEYPARAVEASELGIKPPGEGEDPIAYLQLLQSDPTLENGVSGSIRVTLDQREDVLYVHKEAIKTADGGQFVYMLDENGLRIRRGVTTGLESGDYIEVVNGLEEGDMVIVD